MKQLIIAILLIIPVIGFSQNNGQCKQQKLSYEELRAEKVSYLTTRLDLSIEEAQKFWPVYNTFQKELEALSTEMHSIMHSLKHDSDEMTSEELEKKIDRLVEIESEEASLRAEYHEKFKMVLPIEKVALLYHFEKDFRRFLLEKYREHGRGGMHGNPTPEGRRPE